MSVNKAIIVGNVGQDPEIKYTQAGQQVVRLSVATSENWTDKATNEKKEKTEWHKIVIFGKLADIAAQYIHKGSKVYVEGTLRTNKWQDKTGADRYTTEIVLSGFNSTLQMLDNKSDSEQVKATLPTGAPNMYKELAAAQEKSGTPPKDFEDDIPF